MITKIPASSLAGSIRRNLAGGNSDFAIWQMGTGGALAAATGQTSADMWSYSAAAGFAGYTVTRQAAALAGFSYCLRYQRTAAGTDANSQMLTHDLESVDSIAAQSKTVTLSFWMRAGANFSAPGVTVHIESGTGTDQARRSGAYTGSSDTTTTIVPTTSWVRYTLSKAVSSGATQLGVWFAFACAGTAGAADYIEITGVQLEISDVATAFEVLPMQQRLALCQRRLHKSFAQATAPTTALGTTTGAYFWVAATAGATAQRGIPMPLPVTMRIAPTVTTYNPINANAQAYDAQAAADCSGITAGSSEYAVWFLATGAAGTAVGNRLAVQFLADARF